MAPTSSDVCEPWTDPDRMTTGCSSAIQAAIADVPVEELEDAALVASNALWNLSGRRYGICSDLVRPCPKRPGLEADGWREVDAWPAPAGWNPSWGWWRDGSWCGCTEGPKCSGCGGAPSQIRLGGRPILPNSVTVTIDGSSLDSSAWQILDGAWLVRVDGDRWPCSNDFTVPDGEAGTWSVAFEFGRPIPAGGVRAATVLSRELALECAGSNLCRLPARVSTVTRQQTTMAILDPMEFLKSGNTGLLAVDLFLSSERYGRGHRSAVFVNPDRPRVVRRVSDAPGS